MRNDRNTAFDGLMEQLIENGYEDMAEIFAGLFNLAMRIERERFLGADLPTIQRVSGHKTLAIVLRYPQVQSSHIDRAVKAIGRGLPVPSEPENPDTVTLELRHQRRRREKRAVGAPHTVLK